MKGAQSDKAQRHPGVRTAIFSHHIKQASSSTLEDFEINQEHNLNHSVQTHKLKNSNIQFSTIQVGLREAEKISSRASNEQQEFSHRPYNEEYDNFENLKNGSGVTRDE